MAGMSEIMTGTTGKTDIMTGMINNHWKDWKITRMTKISEIMIGMIEMTKTITVMTERTEILTKWLI